jgi:hypothetical protein
MSTATTTSTLTQMMKTYYDRNLLKYAEPYMVADKLADHSRDIPKGEGKTVNFTRLVPLDKITSATTEGENPDYVEMEAFEFEKSTAKYSSSIRLTDTLVLTSYCKPLDSAVFLCGQNMGESLNYQYRLAMSLGFYPMRVDNSSTYAKTGTVTTSTSTTIICDTSLTEADHFWVNGLLIWTSGQNKGSAHEVTAFANATGQVTFTPALKDAADVGDTFRIVVTTGLAATNVVTCAAVERAVAILKHYKAPKWDGKNYVGIISPFVTYDFMQDSAWVNAQHYASPENIKNGELGKWGGVRWYEDTEPFTTLITDGTADASDRGFSVYSAAGTINQTPIFGKGAIAGSRIKGVKDLIIVKVSGPTDTSNPTNAYSYVSWKAYFVAVVLNGLFGVQILSGASTPA